MISPTFDFNLDELANDEDSKIDIPNPSDILSSMNYTGKDARGGEKNGTSKDSTTKNGNNNNNNNNKNNNTNNNSNNNQNNTSSGNGNNTNHNNSNGTDGNTGGMNDLDLDMNNLLGSDTLLLDGLNMNLLDQGLAGDTNIGEDEEFDVDSFLNQFGGAD